jgi:hypothetical protein
MASLFVNTTFLAALACFIVALTGWIAGWQATATLRGLRGAITSWPLVVLLLAGGFLNSTERIYAGSLNPGDFMQDVMAARQFLNHKFMYPGRSWVLIDTELADHPPLVEIRRIPKWMGVETVSPYTTIKVNAHPPLVGLLLAPILYVINFRWIYLLVTLCSSIALIGTIVAVLRGLDITIEKGDFLALTGLAFGWHPVLSTLRNGQSSIFISALITVGWVLLRRKKSFQAGIAVGIATAIKLFPGLLIVYFLFRNRRAFAGGLITFIAAQFLTIAFCGMGNYWGFLGTMFYLSHPFYSRTNMSLAAVATGFLHVRWIGFLILAAGVCLFIFWMGARIARGGAENIDLEYALCTVMQLLLTPIAWSHYLVVLILPLAILASWLRRSEPHWSAICPYIGLLLCFTIPDTTIKYAQAIVEKLTGHYAGWLLTSVFTAGLLLLCAWLALLIRNGKSVPVARS